MGMPEAQGGGGMGPPPTLGLPEGRGVGMKFTRNLKQIK